MKNLKSIWLGLSISVLLYLTTILLKLDLFERIAEVLGSLESFEIDELLIPLIIFSLFALVHVFSQVRKVKIDAEKAKIYTAMLSSTYQILNQLIGQMQQVQVAAKATSGFDQDALAKLDNSISDASMQVEKLSKISNIDEVSILASLRVNT